jgi:hypothetical protein
MTYIYNSLIFIRLNIIKVPPPAHTIKWLKARLFSFHTTHTISIMRSCNTFTRVPTCLLVVALAYTQAQSGLDLDSQ